MQISASTTLSTAGSLPLLYCYCLLLFSTVAATAAGSQYKSDTKNSEHQQGSSSYKNNNFPPKQRSIPGQLPPIGNGYIATFVNSSEVFVAGVFSGQGTKSRRATFPSLTNVYLECALEKVRGKNTNGDDDDGGYPFYLNVFDGVVSLTPTSSPDGLYKDHGDRGNQNQNENDPCSPISYEQRWYTHRKYPHIMVTEIYATNPSPKTAVTMRIVNLSPRFNTSVNEDSSGLIFQGTHYDPFVIGMTSPIAVYQVSEAEEPDLPFQDEGGKPFIAVGQKDWIISTPGGDQWNTPSYFKTIQVTIPANITKQKLIFRRLVGYKTSLDETRDSQLPAAVLAYQLDLDLSSSAVNPWLYQLHVYEMRWLWDSGIYLDEDSAIYKPVIFAQYQILCSMRHGWPYSTSPGGLPTNGYNGHTFWDVETWVNPNLMLFQPDIANGSAVQYRLDRLATARINAAMTLKVPGGGAAFPWESAFTGEDVCPAPDFAHTELHVTADIANSLRQFWTLNQNVTWLATVWPLLRDTALFWVHRTTAFEDEANNAPVDKPVHLYGVTPPDEYAVAVNDSVFTNYAVKLAVQFTIFAGTQILNQDTASIPEFAAMQRLVRNIVLVYNSSTKFHPEYDGYNNVSQHIKQADVVLLNYPLMMPMETETIYNDLNFYANPNRTVPNDSGASTMTWSMFAIGYFSIAEWSKGLDLFYKGYENNAFPPYYQWYQSVNGSGNDDFISGAGGFLQSIWAGFGGVRVGWNQMRNELKDSTATGTSSDDNNNPSGDGASTGPSSTFSDIGASSADGPLRILANRVVLPPDAKTLKLQGLHYRGSVFTFMYTKIVSSSSSSSASKQEKGQQPPPPPTTTTEGTSSPSSSSSSDSGPFTNSGQRYQLDIIMTYSGEGGRLCTTGYGSDSMNAAFGVEASKPRNANKKVTVTRSYQLTASSEPKVIPSSPSDFLQSGGSDGTTSSPSSATKEVFTLEPISFVDIYPCQNHGTNNILAIILGASGAFFLVSSCVIYRLTVWWKARKRDRLDGDYTAIN